jgi:hypothetical protein
MPRAVLFAGWCPRNLHGARLRRPALPEGSAALAAGWRLHRGELEPGDEDKIPPTAILPKVAWPPTRSTEAKDGHDVNHVQTPPTSEQEPSPQKDSSQKEGHMPPRCRSKGEKALYKVLSSDEDRGGREDHAKDSHGGAGSHRASHHTCNQTPTYIRGSGPLV